MASICSPNDCKRDRQPTKIAWHLIKRIMIEIRFSCVNKLVPNLIGFFVVLLFENVCIVFVYVRPRVNIFRMKNGLRLKWAGLNFNYQISNGWRKAHANPIMCLSKQLFAIEYYLKYIYLKCWANVYLDLDNVIVEYDCPSTCYLYDIINLVVVVVVDWLHCT